MNDKLKECCESWCASEFARPAPVGTIYPEHDQPEDIAERLAAHLRKHGAIFPMPREDGKTPGMMFSGRGDDFWRESSREYKLHCEQKAAEILAAFPPKVEPIATVELDGCKQTPFDMLQLLMKKTGYAIPGHNPDSYNNALFEIVRHFAPKVESVPAEATIPSHPPTPEQIDAACLSYAHDFGLKDEQSRSMMRFRAREWLLAWQKVGDQQQPSPAPTVADIIDKIPAIDLSYRHKENTYKVVGLCHRRLLSGEVVLWVDYRKESNGRTFGCPVSEWIESDYRLVEGEANE